MLVSSACILDDILACLLDPLQNQDEIYLEVWAVEAQRFTIWYQAPETKPLECCSLQGFLVTWPLHPG